MKSIFNILNTELFGDEPPIAYLALLLAISSLTISLLLLFSNHPLQEEVHANPKDKFFQECLHKSLNRFFQEDLEVSKVITECSKASEAYIK